MADPLSLAASVVGLITLAGQLTKIISDFTNRMGNVPNSARLALSTVEEMHLALMSIQQVMDLLNEIPERRKKMISVGHLLIVFRESVWTLSELEAILAGQKSNGTSITAWDRVRWLKEEDKILTCVRRLESHKISLSMMLIIFQCESDLEAKESLKTLHKTVDAVVQQNETLLRMLDQYYSSAPSRCHTITTFNDNQSETEAIGFRASEASIVRNGNMDSVIPPQQFEKILGMTRVYRRAEFNETDLSFASSIPRTKAWSVLSGLSLNDISIISVLGLPMTWEEIESIGSGLMFSKLMGSGNTSLVDFDDRSSYVEISRDGSYFQKSGYKIGFLRKLNSTSFTRVDYITIVVLGDAYVGKTALIQQYLEGSFSHPAPTITCEAHSFYARKFALPNLTVRILDTPGLIECESIRNQAIREGDGFVLVYSVAAPDYYERLLEIYRDLLEIKGHSEPIPIVLVATQGENAKSLQPPGPTGYLIARQLSLQFGGGHFEASAKSGMNVEAAFDEVIKRVLRVFSAT